MAKHGSEKPGKGRNELAGVKPNPVPAKTNAPNATNLTKRVLKPEEYLTPNQQAANAAFQKWLKGGNNNRR